MLGENGIQISGFHVTHRPCTRRCPRMTRGRSRRWRTGRASSPSSRISRSSCHPSRKSVLLASLFNGTERQSVQNSSHEVESRGAVGLGGAEREHGGWRDLVDVPRRRARRRRAVFGGKG